TLADAVLDRIVHNAHRLQLKGRQLAQATGAPDGRHLTANNRLWRDHIRPAGDRHPGRHQSERPADFDRNRWPTSIGMPGRHHRNTQLRTACAGTKPALYWVFQGCFWSKTESGRAQTRPGASRVFLTITRLASANR